MSRDKALWSAIPASYTASNYPLQYYFELRRSTGEAWLYPGLTSDLANQPYFVVQPVARAVSTQARKYPLGKDIRRDASRRIC